MNLGHEWLLGWGWGQAVWRVFTRTAFFAYKLYMIFWSSFKIGLITSMWGDALKMIIYVLCFSKSIINDIKKHHRNKKSLLFTSVKLNTVACKSLLFIYVTFVVWTFGKVLKSFSDRVIWDTFVTSEIIFHHVMLQISLIWLSDVTNQHLFDQMISRYRLCCEEQQYQRSIRGQVSNRSMTRPSAKDILNCLYWICAFCSSLSFVTL